MFKKTIFSLFIAMLGICPGIAQSIPTYSNVETSIANGATVRSVTSLEITLSGGDYDAPVGIVKTAGNVTATLTTSENTSEVSGITAKVTKGKLVVSFLKPVATEGVLDITVPAGLTNNLAMPIATMTPEEIIEEGGCTNPEIKLTVNIKPVDIKCVRVTSAVPLTHDFILTETGGLTKDKYGNYAQKYTWFDYYDNIKIAASAGENDFDATHQVKTLYFWFEEDFANVGSFAGAYIKNTTTDTKLNIARIAFKTGNGGDNHKYDILEFAISSDSWIDNGDTDQGDYEIFIPEGVATTVDGMKNEACTLHFTYGDPANAYYPEALNLDDYLGDYVAVKDEGEMNASNESFTLVKIDDAYYVTNLCGSPLQIPVGTDANGDFVLKYTTKGADAFMSTSGKDLSIMLDKNNGVPCIFLNPYGIYYSDGTDTFVGGFIWFEQTNATSIKNVSTVNRNSNVLFNLAGQRVNAPAKGIVIVNGKKVIK